MTHFRTPEGVPVTLDMPSPLDHYKERGVIFGRYGDTPAVIKAYPATPEGEGQLRRERDGLTLLQNRGIPGPRVLHAGHYPDPAGWYLVMERLGGGSPRPVTLDFLERVVATLANHHDAGLLQNDTSPSNFLLVDGRIITLDGATIRAEAYISERVAVRNLAKFFYKLSAAWNDRLSELVRHYYKARGLTPTPRRITAVLKETGRLRRRRAWPQARRSLGNHRWFWAEVLANGSRLVVDRRHVDIQQARSWAAGRAPDGVLVHDVAEGQGYRLGMPHGRGAHYWVAQKLLERMAVPTRQPVVLMLGGRSSRVWMATVPGSVALLDALDGMDAIKAAGLADAVVPMLRRLMIADYRLIIRGLTWSHLRLGPDGPFLDLRPGQPLPSAWGPAWRRHWRQTLERLRREAPARRRDFATGLLARLDTP